MQVEMLSVAAMVPDGGSDKCASLNIVERYIQTSFICQNMNDLLTFPSIINWTEMLSTQQQF